MNIRKNIIQKNRENIRQKLKGTLNIFKLTPQQHQNKNITIGDRTPEPGILQNHFDQVYSLGKKIGEGANGSVYLCTNKTNNKTYAVKISRGDVELLRISKRTFKILKRLNHPNIIKAKSLYLNEVSEKIHFVMEYCPFPCLSQIQYKLSYQQKKQIVKQLLKTLNYLHSQGICHRDVKLDNILYSQKDNQVKLIDFGISKKIFDQKKQFKQMWTSTGTLHYMAPEILSGSAYNQKVDMWAVGVLIYKLFYNSFPFDSQYKSEMIDEISNGEPQYDDSNVILNDLIKHLLCKDHKTRLSAADCLKHPWVENQIVRTKQRLGSGDDTDFILQYRLRNYSVSVSIPESPEIKISRQDKISQLKQLNIFEEKRKYRSLALKDY